MQETESINGRTAKDDSSGAQLPGAADELAQALSAAIESPELPRVVILYGETGRGKTYAVQKFFDQLAAESPGVWKPELTPRWPPESRREVNRDRKRVQPSFPGVARGAEPPFYWLATGASPTEGAARVDMSASFQQQLYEQFASTLSSTKRRKGIGVEGLKLALDSLGAFLAPVGLGKAIVEHALAFAQLSRGIADFQAERRATVHRAFSLVLRERGGTTPAIVVLDDAQSVGSETLGLVSGLIAESSLDLDGAVERTYLPKALGTTMPGPVLIVCTVWEHRLARTFEDPFQVWLDELQDLGINITWIPCDEISPDEAAALCAHWQVDPSRREEFVQHVKRSSPDPTVNQLVLAVGIGQLEERRDPITRELVLDAGEIARVATIPEQHLRDRLEAVREAHDGPYALALLRTIAEVGPAPPVRLLHELGSNVPTELTTSATSVLVGHQLLSVPDDLIAPFARGGLQYTTLDPDIQRFVVSEDDLTLLQAHRLFGACCRSVTWLCEEFLRDELARPPLSAISSIERLLSGVASVVLRGDAGGNPGDESARLIATVIVRAEASVDVRACSAQSIGYAYAMGVLREATVAQLELACADFGASRITANIVERTLTTEKGRIPAEAEKRLLATLRAHATYPLFADILADALQRRDRRKEAIKVLRAVPNPPPSTTVLMARLLLRLGQKAEAVELLRSIANESAAAALLLADLLSKDGRTQEAIDLLEPLVERFQEVPLKLADLLTAEGRSADAVSMLLSIAGAFQGVPPRLADLLVDLGRPAEAVAALEPLVGAFQDVPGKLAEVLTGLGRLDEAETVLTRALQVFPSRAAEGLAGLWLERGEPAQAISVLWSAARIDPNSATRLAGLLVAADRIPEAIEVLLPFARGSSNNATQVADLLILEGRSAEAADILEQVAGRYMNAAVKLAQLVMKADTNRAIQTLRPWSFVASVAGTLAGMLLRRGDVAEASEVLSKTGAVNAETRWRLTALKAAARLLAGGAYPAAFRRVAPQRDKSMYYVAMAVLCDCGREDLVALVVDELADWPLIHRVAADLFLTLGLARDKEDDGVDLRLLARVIWASPDLASKVVQQLRGALWSWAQQARSVQPPMTGDKALSCVEVLSALVSREDAFDSNDDELIEAVIAQLSIEASASVPLFGRLLRVQLISDVANDVVSRAATPPGWRSF